MVKVNTYSTYLKIILFILILLTVLLVCIHTVQASGFGRRGNGGRERVIVSVRIEKDDSLWRIASQYYTDEYKDVRDFVKEIKKANGLTDDTIHYGNYIIVPHYQ